MDNITLPEAIEPDYWNVVFHPASSRFWRFKHVSAFSYFPGVATWILYDCQWGGIRIMAIKQTSVMAAYTRGCTIVKFSRRYEPFALFSRLGFYCVPAIKQLLGLSCVAVTPDGLYRYLIKHGGSVIGARIEPSPAAARPELAGRTANGTS